MPSHQLFACFLIGPGLLAAGCGPAAQAPELSWVEAEAQVDAPLLDAARDRGLGLMMQGSDGDDPPSALGLYCHDSDGALGFKGDDEPPAAAAQPIVVNHRGAAEGCVEERAITFTLRWVPSVDNCDAMDTLLELHEIALGERFAERTVIAQRSAEEVVCWQDPLPLSFGGSVGLPLTDDEGRQLSIGTRASPAPEPVSMTLTEADLVVTDAGPAAP